MADREEVLRIRMVADDDATRKVQQLNQELARIPEPVRRSTQEAKRSVNELTQALQNLGKEQVGMGRSMTELAGSLGKVGGALTAFGYITYRVLRDVAGWSRELVQMGNAARMAGMRPGEFKSIVNQLAFAGVSAKEATSGIQQANRAYAELMQAGSQRRDSLFAMAGQNRDQMANFVIMLGTFNTSWQRFNYIRQAGENVYYNTWNRTHDQMLAKQQQLMFLEQNNAAWLVNVNRDFTAADEEQLNHQDKLNAKAVELNNALEREHHLREEIFAKTLGWTVTLETRFVEITTTFEEQVLKTIDTLQDIAAHGMKPTAPMPWMPPGGLVLPGQGWAPHPTTLPPAQPMAPPGGWRGMLPPWLGGGGGGAQHFGEPDAADVLGLGPGSLGYGNISQGWRRSTNIEDARNQTQTVDTNTKEFHNLNDKIQRLLDTDFFKRMGGAVGGAPAPAVAMAKGGVVQGPVHALVGEAGPEAIINQGGQTTIVNGATHVVLGQTGTQAVVPLRSSGGTAGGATSNYHVSMNVSGSGGRAGTALPMAEGGVVEGKHVPPRALFSTAQFQDYLSRTQLLSNPVSDIGGAIKSGWQGLTERFNRPAATTPSEALAQALPQYSTVRALAGAALSPFSGAIDTTVGRAFAGATGMPRAEANVGAERAMTALTGAPGVTDLIRLPLAERGSLQLLRQASSQPAPQLPDLSRALGGGSFPAATAPATGGVAFSDTHDRRTLDRASAGGGGTTEGTLTIEHETPRGAAGAGRRAPLFRPSALNRQTQMLPASQGPVANEPHADTMVH